MMRRCTTSFVALLSACVVSAAAASSALAQSDASERVANIEAAPAEAGTLEADGIGAALRERLALPPGKLGEGEKEDRAALSAYYAAPDSKRLWVEPSGLTAGARAAVAELDRAADWGLAPAEFKKPQLGVTPSDGELAAAEIDLSLAVLKYARHARGGRIADPTKQLSSYLDRKPQLKDPGVVLAEIAVADQPDAYLRSLHPQHPQFEKLRAALLALRSAALEPDAKAVHIPKGSTIQPGKSHPDLALIRKRLDVAVPVVDGQPGDATLYDDTLKAAVMSFQAERGIKATKGAITSATRAALNAELRPRVGEKQILASMEAWRWMPDELGDTHVWVNIPEYLVRVVKGGKVVYTERIIIGKTDTQTPVFSDNMATVVFHPFWGVPDSIKVKELYPGLARGGDSLARNGLRIQYNGREVNPRSIDWTTANIKNFHVYQPPGPSNVLGQVKFLFPNKHQVYMHDTPTKHLFASSVRTYSHGCMRVRNPLKFAEVLLGEDKGWDGNKITSLVKGGPQNNEIGLERKIPIHITYFTAWVDDDGKLSGAKDIYGHEQRIALALDGKWSQIARGRNHLAPVKAEPIARLAESKAKYSPNPIGDLFGAIFGGN